MHALGELRKWIDRADGWSDNVLRLKHGVVPQDLVCTGDALLKAVEQVLDLLGELRAEALKRAPESPQLAQQLLGELGTSIARATQIADTWTLMLRHEPRGAPPTARWIERAGDDVVVAASPIDAGERLQRALWQRVSAAVVTSATLTACGTFELFLRQTGLDRLPSVRTVRLASPFNYREQARLVVPRMFFDPGDASAHTQEVIRLLPDLVKEGASLVLFTSAQQMNEVHERMPEQIQLQTLMQGRLAKAAILQRHRQRVDEGRASTIFGLAAFQEGVDLPGHYCTHVVIVRIPFSVPSHPWEQARAEWLQRCGRSPFREVAVPEAAVRLSQAVGRLIRTQTDRGTVTILDRRLVTRRYGQELLRSLPPMRLELCDDANDVGAKDLDYRNPSRNVEGHRRDALPREQRAA
jgi:ATP-dependent DNA helicase DinG